MAEFYKTVTEPFLRDLRDLPIPEGVYVAEYVWLDGGYKLRSKSRTLYKSYAKAEDYPKWNYDGSSCGQAPGEDSEVILYPRACYWDPFRGKPNVLVMCDTYTPQGEPLPTNSRVKCAKVMDEAMAMGLEPWFGIEQEFFMMDKASGKPLGFPKHGQPEPQGPYYCGVGALYMEGRAISDAHYRACLYAGLKISGTNAEVAPGQWEYQIGPTVGMETGDMVWMARYLMERIAEKCDVVINSEPKPVKGDWNGSGAHTNFSTKPMREPGGLEGHIIPALERLSKKHAEHIAAYGAGNEARLTGRHETASYKIFKWGRADRGASCRVGHETMKEGFGYFEDRRPAGSMDPYVVSGMIVSTCCDIPM
ncbi:Glutamine synthetase, chloroplastic [Porphyridium purpureum]|uniref:Glutamine synthetase n=1 Tax=Porphyridium purpureum TaxID=35688 RepID=A0A5J4YPA5_PORPP|nr:Glutamine synthetase, chloroplastic [Porphyridium purpureum]|eukprot:POR3310..scf295_9